MLASAVTRGAERDGEDASPVRCLLRCVVNVERHPSKLLMQVHRRRGRARACVCVCRVFTILNSNPLHRQSVGINVQPLALRLETEAVSHALHFAADLVAIASAAKAAAAPMTVANVVSWLSDPHSPRRHASVVRFTLKQSSGWSPLIRCVMQG